MAEDVTKLDPSVNEIGETSFLKSTLFPAVVILVVILGGIATGWVFSGKKITGVQGGSIGKISTAPGSEVVSGGKEFGSKDKDTFKNNAQGTLEKGGIEGEGTYHLVRDGGPSQYVYLTSSVVDLEALEGQKIEVWGETMGAKKAGWLMDVGRVKILE